MSKDYLIMLSGAGEKLKITLFLSSADNADDINDFDQLSVTSTVSGAIHSR